MIAGNNARDRIGNGPWLNAKSELVAKNVDDLHKDAKINKQADLDESGKAINGRGEKPNKHDILTGSDSLGQHSTAGGDTTCKNWTSGSEGSAIMIVKVQLMRGILFLGIRHMVVEVVLMMT